jgi:hypothetical protein
MSFAKSSALGLTTLVGTAFVSSSVLIPFSAIPAVAEVRLLGETKLSFTSNDTDIVRVASCSPRVTKLQLRAKNADANIKLLVLRFKNGDTEQIDVRSTLKRGQSTRWIDLPRHERCIDKIGIIGSSDLGGNLNQARIEFLGEVQNVESSSGSGQPRLLGETKLSMFSNEKDVVRVSQCGVSQLQLRAKNADANIKTLVVKFKNGQTEELNVRSTLKKDQTTRWIPLANHQRCVSEVRILGDSSFNFQFSPAKVLFYGK